MPRPETSRNSHSLSILTHSRHNQSRSSIASSTTFHTAQLASSRMPSPAISSRTPSPVVPVVQRMKRRSDAQASSTPSTPRRSSQFQSIPMSRADSGFSEGLPRRSSSKSPSDYSNSSSRRHKKSQSTPSARPCHKRASKSTGASTYSSASPLGHSTSSSTGTYTTRSGAAVRPALQHRYTTTNISTTNSNSSQASYQFFQFPSFVEPEGSNPTTPPHSRCHSSTQNPYSTVSSIPAASPPPATVQYWTSEETRRLEYAAIDAASHGIRGFVNKLVPSCILPKDYKQPRFCRKGAASNDDGSEDDDDTGSVRRYRLRLEGEKDVGTSGDEGRSSGRRLRSWWTRKSARA